MRMCWKGVETFLNALFTYLLALQGGYEGVFENTNYVKCTHIIYARFEYKFQN